MEEQLRGAYVSSFSPTGFLREQFSQLRRDIREHTAPGRDQSLALTKIDEAEMWALRGLTG